MSLLNLQLLLLRSLLLLLHLRSLLLNLGGLLACLLKNDQRVGLSRLLLLHLGSLLRLLLNSRLNSLILSLSLQSWPGFTS